MERTIIALSPTNIDKMKLLSNSLSTLFLLICFGSSAQNSTGDCNLFEDGPNDTWPRVITSTTPDDPNSGDLQSLLIEVSALPAEGANYRVAKTVANGNWFFGNAIPLEIGTVTVSVSAVDFDRSVKFQFSSSEVEFVLLEINGESLTCAGDLQGIPLASCSVIEDGPNASWPHVITSTTPDDPNSGEAQTMEVLVTALPAEGGECRVVKTVANGNWDNGSPVSLEIGTNQITVGEVDFARSVKFQFSSGAIEFAELLINGEALDCGDIQCEDLDDDGICDDVDDCVGTLDALGVCNGTCAEDANANGICDADEDVVNPSTFCGPGTAWDEDLGQCVGAQTCMGDFDGDGAIATADLLGFLAIFGITCL